MAALAQIPAGGASYDVRRAALGDVPAIVALIAADQVGAARDGGDPAPYERAFARIDADPAQLLVVAADGAGTVAARCS